MRITGRTNTSEILINERFKITSSDGDTRPTPGDMASVPFIDVIDSNGVDVSECFGIETRVTAVETSNIPPSEGCNTSLEIVVSEGVNKPVVCDFTNFIKEQDTGLITFYFDDGSASKNTHPECCESLGFTPEIGPERYFVCRWRGEIDVNDCDNYTPTSNRIDDYVVFDFVTGSTVTTVPSAQCCSDNGFVDEMTDDGIKCIEEVEYNPCEGLEVVEPAQDFGAITFINPVTEETTTTVPTAECCSVNGFSSYERSDGTIICYNSLLTVVPTVSITNDLCCEVGPPPTVSITNDACCQLSGSIFDSGDPRLNLSPVQP